MNQRLAAMYARDPRRYLTLAVAVIVAGACAIELLWGILASRTYGIGFEDAVLPTAATALTAIPGALLATWFVRGDLRPLVGWALGRGPRDQGTRHDLLPIALGAPLRAALAVLIAGIAVGFPLIFAIFAAATSFDFQDFLLAIGGGLLGVLYMAIWIYNALELVLRPLRAELGSTITRERRERIGSFSLISRVLIGIGVTSVVLGFATGVLIAPSDSSFFEGARIAAIAVGISVIVGGSLALPLAKGALAPIDDLIEGTRSVAAGDLETRVPVTSVDEFADLVISFNEMVDGLREREALRSRNLELLDDVRRQAEQLSASRSRIVAASDEARRRVERDLHDGAQQSLMLLNLKLAMAERTLADDRAAAAALLAECRSNLSGALDELRDLAHGIYPAVLTNDGLRGALTEAIVEAPLPASLDCDGIGRYDAELEAAVYFCCLEALQNAAKHAGDGARAAVRVSAASDRLSFTVADDGQGFDISAVNGSAGLQNMADRIGALGGELRVESEPGGGTTVAGTIALDR
jgi:signal transduction histidine kinase